MLKMKSKLPKNSLNIKVSDELSVRDKITTTKMWFNGAKHFITVKVLPKHK